MRVRVHLENRLSNMTCEGTLRFVIEQAAAWGPGLPSKVDVQVDLNEDLDAFLKSDGVDGNAPAGNR